MVRRRAGRSSVLAKGKQYLPVCLLSDLPRPFAEPLQASGFSAYRFSMLRSLRVLNCSMTCC